MCPASIPIVTQVIEPLKAKAAALRPGHGEALATRCARSSRRAAMSIPTALVLRVRGLAALRDLPRALRLLVRGKIDPIKTCFRRKTPASAAAARVLGLARPSGDRP